MKLTKLRLAGFKTFVEPAEVPIEPGLTGVVGPNGCGKSNLVEALRWVMGESSFRNMRGAGMDDVIFAGSSDRPARNMAEVALTLDNAARTAPAQFNDGDVIEVTRRIEREEGSTYRVNGREVRARDVQLLFADASTGARSPALVRQGQIAEIIAARPQSRRRIIEEAAGISGLHSRRHEAELRLKGAEDNLLRLEDVLAEIGAQIENLGRQARQAERYRGLAAEIRKAEAVLALIGHRRARDDGAEAGRALEAAIREVAGRTQVQAEAARHQAVAAHGLPALRDGETAAAAGLVRLRRGLDELDAEERRTKQRAVDLERRLAELSGDLDRQTRLGGDAAATLDRLLAEHAGLVAEGAAAGATAAAAAVEQAGADARLAEAEARHGAVQAALADLSARRAALGREARDIAGRAARDAAEHERLMRERAALDQDSVLASLDGLRSAVATAGVAADAGEVRATEARATLAAAREREAASRQPLADAERTAQRLDTEIGTLRKLLAPAAGRRFPPVIDAVAVERGYEAALGAALGDDLEASAQADAPSRWAGSGAASGDPALPDGAKPLAAHVGAPDALARRLAQIGVVSRADGARLRAALKPGQRLVSREGDLWRWDGLTVAAEAPSAAARRLAERNRLGDLERAAQAARASAEEARDGLDAAQAAVAAAAGHEGTALDRARAARRGLDLAREALAAAERRATATVQRRSAVAEALLRLAAGLAEAGERVKAAEATLAALPSTASLEAELLGARAGLAESRAAAAEARLRVQGLLRETELRGQRLAAIAAERAAWRERAEGAAEALAAVRTRLDVAEAEGAALLDAPDVFLVERRRLVAAIEQAEATRRAAADRLAAGETGLAEADRAARAALDGLGAAREARAAAEARREAAVLRLEEAVAAIAESHATDPAGLFAQAGLAPGDTLPAQDVVERRLAALRAERERLGAVNLRAAEELREATAKRDGLSAEREDLTEAIRRLRQAIGALNREGRERLLAAFEVVNGHFQALFSTLFGGGTAELTLVDSDDPLEAGLEILARPPGKKPQVMTLLSGGEQALTATALIFAVFLTNPSPICVLDEVDAPLDDANVERYCDLLAEMVRQTSTRFIVITHNPITMARMDRLFGVTMAERGVSQMVSVDLETAEALREVV